jgi:hypothetical protein
MRRPVLLITCLGIGVGCKTDYNIKTTMQDEPPLALEVTSPSYGVFLGDAPAVVEGTVSPTNAILEIEGQRVYPAADGTFRVEVPVDYAYRNVDVKASLRTQELSWRTPVFRGEDPALTWPNGVSLRLLPQGMERMGMFVGQIIDDTGWAAQLSALLPAYESDLFQVRPIGVFHDPTVVLLYPMDEVIGAGVTLQNIKLEYEVAVDWLGLSTELSAGFDEIGIDAELSPWLDGDGILWLGLDEPGIILGDVDLVLGPLDGWLAELVIDWATDFLIEPLGDLVLGFVLAEFSELEVGGPLATDIDLLGTPMSIALSELYTEALGVGAEIGIGIGSPAPTTGQGLVIPDESTPGTENADAAIALHEGLLQVAIGDLLFDLLDTQLDAILGLAGPLLGNIFTALPGGEQAPADAEWCFSFEPGDAYVARMHEGTAPLGTIYLPDFVIDAGIQEGGLCTTWIKASMATEIDLKVTDGSKLGLDISMPEGALLEYGADDVDADEVVAALGSGLAGTLAPLLGSFAIDLGDLLGGAGGDSDDPLSAITSNLSIEIQDSRRFVEGEAAEDESMYAVSIGLFDVE